MHEKRRCFGNESDLALYAEYHDKEWGVPTYDDQRLLEMLILEGAQAGLSWEIILKKREGYRALFHAFIPEKVATMTDDDLQQLLNDERIVRNRSKIYSARKNARIFLDIQKQHGSFAKYLWAFVDNKPIINHWNTPQEVPANTVVSDTISKDLKRMGMGFIGSTIIYAYMQAVGLVNDHCTFCWRYEGTHQDAP